jgi:hypothetical protein
MLYKYRTLDNFKNIVDIILKNRLYAAKYSDLNDPMEGHYLYSPNNSPKEIIEKIKGRKKQLRIVSLSRTSNNYLMWSHYADGHRGIVIGVEINKSKYNVKSVKYINKLINLNDIMDVSIKDFAEKVLIQKLALWEYEQEERAFIDDGSTFIDVEIKEVIIGRKMSTQNYSFIKELINKLNPEINIKKIQDIDADFDYIVDEE